MVNLRTKEDAISYQAFCNKLPAAGLALEVAKVFAANAKIMNILRGAIAPYNRDDWDVREVPGVSIYYKNVNTQSMYWFEEGTMYLEFVLPPSLPRERLHEVTAVLIDATNNLFQNLDTFYSLEAKLPGLRSFGYSTKWDPSKSEVLGQNNFPILVAEFDFKIDLLVWRKYITGTLGADPLNPCVQIYKAVTGYLLYVTPSVFEGN